MKLRVCWIIPTLDEGGAEKQLCLLARGIDRRHFEPQVIALTRTGPRLTELQKADVPVSEIQKRAKFDPFALMKLYRAIRTLQPHIVHTWLFAANAYGRMAARMANVPVIFGGERCVDPWKRWTHQWIDAYLARQSAGIIANSSAIVDFYASRGIDRDRFHVIHNGVERSTVESISRDQAASRMGIDPKRLWIGAVGRLWGQKGYKDMIWAAEMLRLLHESTTLVIIGEGPERQRLEHYRDQTHAAKEIRFLGHRSDVPQLLPHFDLFWNASLFEGQSNAILEAMMAEVPVVATDIVGTRDLIEHGKTGMLFPPKDVEALIKMSTRLIESPTLRRELAQNAKEMVERSFDVRSMIQSHERLYLKSYAERVKPRDASVVGQ